MGLPYSPVATDEAIIAHTFWNQLVSNYGAIFDGSAFANGTVTTKYGTVARRVRLHAGNTSQGVTLIPGQPYLALIMNSEPGVKNGSISAAGDFLAYTSFEEASNIFVPSIASATLSAVGSGSWGTAECEFILIKLDNTAGSWRSTASVPYPGLTFANGETLQASKVNKVIGNVNSSETTIGSLGIESLKVTGNTLTSMVPLGFTNADEVTTPATINTEKVTTTLNFDITENLESCLVLVSVSADYLWTSNDYRPERVDIRDSENNIVATKEFIWFNDGDGYKYALSCNLLVAGLTDDTYTVELVYYLQGSGSHAVNTAYPAITNITALAIGA